MTRNVAILVMPTRDASIQSQVAAICLALGRLNWHRWRPSLYVFTHNKGVERSISKWWPYHGQTLDPGSSRSSPVNAHGSLFDAIHCWDGGDHDVYVKLDIDTFPARNFEDVLDAVSAAGCIGGVIAHHGFAAWPGLPAREAWRRLADGLIDGPVAFSHHFSLIDDENPEGERFTPFFINSGVIFLARPAFFRIAGEYPFVKKRATERIPVQYFADDVALSLAAMRSVVPTRALPLRYNFPNDEIAAKKFPYELQDARIIHYFRTDEIGRNVFANGERYARFVHSDFLGVNRVFRDHAVKLIGSHYPFQEMTADTASSVAADGRDAPGSEARLEGNGGCAIPPRSSDSVTGCRHFDYARGRPNLYLLMRFKQALGAELGVRRGFEAYRQTVSLPDGEELVHRTIAGARDSLEKDREQFFEVGRAGDRFTLEPPKVIGPGNHRRLEGVTRSFYVACIDGARVRGRSAVIETGDVALLDYEGSEPLRIDDEIEWDPAIFHANSHAAWLTAPPSPARPIVIDCAFALIGAHTDFFGHWMCEYLPKFAAAVLANGMPPVPVLIDADMPATHRESLEFLFPGLEIIEIAAFRAASVRQLWFAPSLMYMPLHEKRNERFSWDAVTASPDRFDPIVRELVRRADLALGAPSGSERIFLARRDFRHRRLVNRLSIEAVAEERGFRIVHPEDLSFARQAAALRSANFIVAPEGSAIFLAMFARPGTRLCILSHPLTDVLADYNGLLSVHGVEICALTGPIVRAHHQTPHDSDYEIAEAGFRTFMEEWLKGGGEDLVAPEGGGAMK